MKIAETEIPGVLTVDAEPREDARGAFARTFCAAELAAAGALGFVPAQANISRNAAARTLRGMHYQAPPRAEAKLVQVTRGAVFDVVVDLRPESPTHLRWFGRRLDAAAMTGLFAPEGVAHGFLTLEPETDVLYHMGRAYEPGFGLGVRWNDPLIAVDWPEAPEVIAERDAAWPDYDPERARREAGR